MIEFARPNIVAVIPDPHVNARFFVVFNPCFKKSDLIHFYF